MEVFAIIAFALAAIEQVRAKGTNLLAWAVLALALLPALAFFRSL